MRFLTANECFVNFRFREYLDVNLSFNHDQVHQFLDKFVAGLHKALVEIRRRILIEDIVDSTKFALLLWAMTYIGHWFNGLSLLILNYVALFTLPKVYENNKTQIDANLEIVREKINLISERLVRARNSPDGGGGNPWK